jgi:hypothetical protein
MFPSAPLLSGCRLLGVGTGGRIGRSPFHGRDGGAEQEGGQSERCEKPKHVTATHALLILIVNHLPPRPG